MASWCGLPQPGEEQSDFHEATQHVMRHGSSLALMALVSTALNDSEDFGDVDPEEDWKTWSERLPGLRLYYAVFLDPSRDGADAVSCVLRAILDPATPARPSGRARIVIDYLTTRPAARGRGLASAAVRFVDDCAAATGSNVYVLALEDSCAYWMEHGFVLEESERLTARLNVFSDTHLLRRVADPPDDGEPGDEELAMEHSDEDEDEDGSDDDDSAVDEMQIMQAVSLLSSHPDAAAREASRALLLRAAANLEREPTNDKFRRLRKANAKVVERVVSVRGAPDVLACLGFADRGDHYEVDAPSADAVVARAKAVAAALQM